MTFDPDLYTKRPFSQKVPRRLKFTQIADYTILHQIGQGGMGSVFKALQHGLERIVALKLLAPHLSENKEYIARFKREAQATGQLVHPNIVQGIDVGFDPACGYWYFAMEYVAGPNLRTELEKECYLSEERVIEIGISICRALSCAEAHRIVHRDIKPDNILMSANGIYKLADLGLAKLCDISNVQGKGLTLNGRTVGTPLYMSPEQVMGDATLDARADIYSLGATLFHLATGEPPYNGKSTPEIMSRHVQDRTPCAHRINGSVSEGLSRVLLRMMEKQPQKRYASANETIHALQQIKRKGHREVRTPRQPYRVQTQERAVTTKGLGMAGLLASGIVGVFLIIVFSSSLRLGKRSPQARKNSTALLPLLEFPKNEEVPRVNLRSHPETAITAKSAAYEQPAIETEQVLPEIARLDEELDNKHLESEQKPELQEPPEPADLSRVETTAQTQIENSTPEAEVLLQPELLSEFARYLLLESYDSTEQWLEEHRAHPLAGTFSRMLELKQEKSQALNAHFSERVGAVYTLYSTLNKKRIRGMVYTVDESGIRLQGESTINGVVVARPIQEIGWSELGSIQLERILKDWQPSDPQIYLLYKTLEAFHHERYLEADELLTQLPEHPIAICIGAINKANREVALENEAKSAYRELETTVKGIYDPREAVAMIQKLKHKAETYGDTCYWAERSHLLEKLSKRLQLAVDRNYLLLDVVPDTERWDSKTGTPFEFEQLEFGIGKLTFKNVKDQPLQLTRTVTLLSGGIMQFKFRTRHGGMNKKASDLQLTMRQGQKAIYTKTFRRNSSYTIDQSQLPCQQWYTYTCVFIADKGPVEIALYAPAVKVLEKYFFEFIELTPFEFPKAPTENAMTFNRKTFELFPWSCSYELARTLCQQMGGQLLSLDSPKEQVVVQEYMLTRMAPTVWTGLLVHNNQWIWNSGKKVSSDLMLPISKQSRNFILYGSADPLTCGTLQPALPDSHAFICEWPVP